MALSRPTTLVLAALLLRSLTTQAGEFDRIEGDTLARLVQSEGVQRRERLNFADIENLPPVLSDARSAFLVVKTGQGNYARVLVTPGFRKTPDGDGAAIPVLVLDRFETFEAGKSGSRLARGASLILFDGFLFDLDGGQVVPPGQGADLEFRKAAGDDAPALRSAENAAMFTSSKPIASALPAVEGPTPGKAIVARDFAGRYLLQADGRWSGLLELQVAADRQVTGRFRSEAQGTSYPVNGLVSAESPQKIEFTIKFPRTEQEYTGFLWSEGKNVLAGSFTMTDRTFGFFAVRERAESLPLK